MNREALSRSKRKRTEKYLTIIFEIYRKELTTPSSFPLQPSVSACKMNIKREKQGIRLVKLSFAIVAPLHSRIA